MLRRVAGAGMTSRSRCARCFGGGEGYGPVLERNGCLLVGRVFLLLLFKKECEKSGGCPRNVCLISLPSIIQHPFHYSDASQSSRASTLSFLPLTAARDARTNAEHTTHSLCMGRAHCTLRRSAPVRRTPPVDTAGLSSLEHRPVRIRPAKARGGDRRRVEERTRYRDKGAGESKPESS